MRRIWDGLLSFISALIAVALLGPVLWFAFQSVRAGDAPNWLYAPIIVLALMLILLIGALLQKALKGISPIRERCR